MIIFDKYPCVHGCDHENVVYISSPDFWFYQLLLQELFFEFGHEESTICWSHSSAHGCALCLYEVCFIEDKVMFVFSELVQSDGRDQQMGLICLRVCLMLLYIPSSWGIFVYREETSSVTRRELSHKGGVSSFLKKSGVVLNV